MKAVICRSTSPLDEAVVGATFMYVDVRDRLHIDDLCRLLQALAKRGTMANTYSLSDYVIHGATEVKIGDGLFLVTPAQQWAYAIELPRARCEVRDEICIAARVEQGCLGVGLLSTDRQAITQEVHVPATGEWREIKLVAASDIGSIVVRNVSQRGPSRGFIRFLGIREPTETPQAPPREIIIDESLFAKFKGWSGRVPAGFTANWAGAMSRGEFEARRPDILARINTERLVGIQSPFDNELILDWAPMMDALVRSRSAFRMAALGAGWGRWLTGGAFLARRLGLDYRLLGVEAEPQHFAWMVQHMDDNNIAPGKRILLNAAASGRPGFCNFEVGNPQSWYGQRIVAKASERTRRTPTVTIEGILARLSPLDYLHMDIQEAELEFLAYCPDLLDEDVRVVNVGTHSAEIETELRKQFGTRGWTALWDIAMNEKIAIRIGNAVHPVQMGDGLQVWLNQNLGTEHV
jgi:FkbM family methyltransferase